MSASICSGRIRTSIQQFEDTLKELSLRRLHQRSDPKSIGSIRIRACAEQQSNDVGTSRNSGNQERRPTKIIPSVYRFLACQRSLNSGSIPLQGALVNAH